MQPNIVEQPPSSEELKGAKEKPPGKQTKKGAQAKEHKVEEIEQQYYTLQEQLAGIVLNIKTNLQKIQEVREEEGSKASSEVQPEEVKKQPEKRPTQIKTEHPSEIKPNKYFAASQPNPRGEEERKTPTLANAFPPTLKSNLDRRPPNREQPPQKVSPPPPEETKTSLASSL